MTMTTSAAKAVPNHQKYKGYDVYVRRADKYDRGGGWKWAADAGFYRGEKAGYGSAASAERAAKAWVDAPLGGSAKRSGKSRDERRQALPLPNFAERVEAIRRAQSHARLTKKTWVVVFRPRTKDYHEYMKDTLERTPINESHVITDVINPKWEKSGKYPGGRETSSTTPRKHLGAGYAYKRVRGEWEDVIVPDEVVRRALFDGYMTIDNTRMAVFTYNRATYAQLPQNVETY